MKKTLIRIAVLCAILEPFLPNVAYADGLRAHSAAAFAGERAAAGRRQALVAEGEGHAAGGLRRGFATESGAYGGRTGRFSRSADGSVSASGQGYASGANGTAQRSGSFTRNADGTASGDRGTTITNANTGNTFEGSTTYNKDTGLSRTATCKDASGNTVSCGSR